MTRKNWNEIAEKQFKAMPNDFQDDWKDLRKEIMQ